MSGASFVAFVADQLDPIGGIRLRAMFGGHGIYRNDVFFGILYKGQLYFKTDETTRAVYRARGMKPFQPNVRQTLKNYYAVPVDVVEDGEALITWAQEALHL